MDKPSFTLADFEGPLDLLLHLVVKNKISILDIQISELLNQYMAFIHSARESDIEIAAEFLEMASRLLHIKSATLLPRQENGEDDREKLVAEILEYSICRQMASYLKKSADGINSYVRQPAAIDYDKTYRLKHDKMILYHAVQMAMQRGKRKEPPSSAAFSGILERKIVSVSVKIIGLLKRMVQQGKMRLHDYFSSGKDKSDMIASFLAVLELVKSKRIVLDEQNEVMKFAKDNKKNGS